MSTTKATSKYLTPKGTDWFSVASTSSAASTNYLGSFTGDHDAGADPARRLGRSVPLRRFPGSGLGHRPRGCDRHSAAARCRFRDHSGATKGAGMRLIRLLLMRYRLRFVRWRLERRR